MGHRYEISDADARKVSDSAIELLVFRLRAKLKGTGVTIGTLRGRGYLLVTRAGRSAQGGADPA